MNNIKKCSGTRIIDGHVAQNWTSIGFGLFDIYTQ